ncbi:MAG: Mrp/NBP35 family ATP-binding protein [Gemmatimonadota bacterium]|nr:Mrp/NBP35 family ATP-binding protein [Gemmatimonadota bacterium]MDH5284803.1 Mrp/NBP35 family ATP-binding protein [Gemmatimonadota bacterium]
MAESLTARVTAALAGLRNPRLETDLISAGMVRELVVTDDGKVSFTFLLSRDDPATLVREARAAVRAVEGVSPQELRISVVDPSGPAPASHAPPQGAPPAGQTHGQAGMVPPPQQPVDYPNLGCIIAVSSGKGGVGKSTVSANLAVALAARGKRVGLMDADVYGPNIPRMFGVFEKPPVDNQKIQPLFAHGVKLMSLGFLIDRDAPAIWRGPIIMKIVQQFLRDVAWGELDYFIVDLPPGTGDAQLSLVQSCHVASAVIVTTPQEVAVGDALRGAKMFEKVNVPVTGVIENMSPWTDPATGQRFEMFGSGGGRRLAEELRVPLLGSVPLQPGLADLADRGKPILVANPGSPAATELNAIAERLLGLFAARPKVLPVLQG